MGQGEVLDIINQSDEWLTSKQITNLSGLSRSTVSRLLQCLVRQNEIKIRNTKYAQCTKEYHRMDS